ncbi:MAG: copper resistance system multicopper oxidase [Bdellovibrionales bacterium]|nr:copper resistance system multicopper oxidase [Bdellovibrionales bacterium]
MKRYDVSRRQFIGNSWEWGLLTGLTSLLPSYAWAEVAKLKEPKAENSIIDLSIARTPFIINGKTGSAVTVNGTVPGPILRFREGQEAVIRVTNKLEEATSIHWHGILLPPEMDGVPGVSFAGIMPGKTFTYRFPVKQSGTYWYHSHSGGQELEGLYGPLIIDPLKPDPYSYDREYVILLSDWSFMAPMKIIGKLKKRAAYFNYQKRTIGDFIADVKSGGFSPTLSGRMQWQKMRMDPTDISDVTGATYNYLMNGLSPEGDWTGIFRKGERIRLRFIDAGAMTIFDVRIPGLKMTVVQADGQNVQPVSVDELRIGNGETYDVIVEPKDEGPYAIFAETIDRSGYALGTLASKVGMKALFPERRKRPIRSMEDMGMSMADMPMDASAAAAGAAIAMPEMKMEAPAASEHAGMAGMKTNDQTSDSTLKSEIPGSRPIKHGPDSHGPGNSVIPMETKNRLHEPGTGLEKSTRRVLVYTDLKALKPFEDQRKPAREIELHLTGNMERYMWSIDGKKYSENSDPIPFHFGERLRLTFVNDTMMEHPMHLHGMWMYLENGSGSSLPRKHTVIVKPAERLSVTVTADALGDWAFHCHMLIHMEMGMFRVVRVAKRAAEVQS